MRKHIKERLFTIMFNDRMQLSETYQGKPYTDKYQREAQELIDKIEQDAEERGRKKVLERVKLETDAVVCECGDKWNDSDLADYVNEELSKLKEDKDE